MGFGSEQALSSSPPSPLWGWVANAASRVFSPQPLSRELNHLKNILAYCKLNLDHFESATRFSFCSQVQKNKRSGGRGRIRWVSNHYIANLSQWSDSWAKRGSKSTLTRIAGSCQLGSTWAAGRVEARGQGYICHLYFSLGKMVRNGPIVNFNKKHRSCEVWPGAERTAANRGSEARSHFSPFMVHQASLPVCQCPTQPDTGAHLAQRYPKKPELCWAEQIRRWSKRGCKSLMGFMG